MAQKLYRMPSQRPIQDPRGGANGLARYTSMRAWVEAAEAGKGEIFIYEDFATGFSCSARKASDETKNAWNSWDVSTWKVIAIGAHTETGTIGIVNNTVGGRLELKTNDSADDYTQIATFNDVCRPDRPWSFEASMGLVDVTNTDFGIGVAKDLALLSDAGTSANGCVFQRPGHASNNTQCITSEGGTDTTTDSLVAPSDSTFVTYGIDYDGIGTVRYFIDGSVVATHTGFVATSSMRPFFEMKNVGGATATAYLDHIAFYQSM